LHLAIITGQQIQQAGGAAHLIQLQQEHAGIGLSRSRFLRHGPAESRQKLVPATVERRAKCRYSSPSTPQRYAGMPARS